MTPLSPLHILASMSGHAGKDQVVLHDPEKRRWRRFSRPCHVLQTHHVADIIPLLAEVEERVQRERLFAAGWIAYEAARAFDPAFRTFDTAFPLAWFGLYTNPLIVSTLPVPREQVPPDVIWKPTVSRMAYEETFSRIKEHIAAGETYQVNYTYRLRTSFAHDPWNFFLRTCADAPYGAFLDTESFCVCSASPELFFSLQGDRLVSRPMKGTVARGRTFAEDSKNAQWLSQSEKNRAENVMIVDMVRNDLGRVAAIGSVKVSRLYAIEKYPTVWQMTSTVEARTGASLTQILRALFPCASITGAPKIKTMEIIAAIETTPRNIYTGAIGFFGPGRQALFNVAIRTVVIDKATGRAEYGIGGGIVWDSTPHDEYEECLNKAQIILNPVSHHPFDLLETLRWSPQEGYFLLSRHLERLRESALYFGYPYPDEKIRTALSSAVKPLSSGIHRVRLLLSSSGKVVCGSSPLEPPDGRPVRVRLAKEAIHSRDPFLYHKTTRREAYERARASWPDADDVLLYNEAGEITESCIANVVIPQNGRLLTPPVSCGLLNGTFRAELLARGEIAEEKVSIAAVKEVGRFFLVNSLRKWREAFLDPKD